MREGKGKGKEWMRDGKRIGGSGRWKIINEEGKGISKWKTETNG